MINDGISIYSEEDIIKQCWSISPEGNTRQTRAELEGATPDAGDAVTNCDARQAGAALERI